MSSKRSDLSSVAPVYDATTTRSAHQSKRPKRAFPEAAIHRRDPRLDISYCLENNTPAIEHNNHNTLNTAPIIRGSDYGTLPRLGSQYICNGYSNLEGELPQNGPQHIQDSHLAMPQQWTWREQSLIGDVASNGLPNYLPYPEIPVIPSSGDRLLTSNTRMSNIEHGSIECPAPVDAPQLRTKEFPISISQPQSPEHELADAAKADGTLDAFRSSTPRMNRAPSSKRGLVDPEVNSQGFTYIPLDEPNPLAGYAPDDVFEVVPSLFHEAFIHELIQPTLHNIDDVGLHHPPTHIGESNHDASDLLPWHDGSPEELNPFVLAPEDTASTGVHFSDSTAATFPPLDWNDFVLDF